MRSALASEFVVAGGSGQIGQGLVPRLVDAGHQVVVLSRSPRPDAVRSVSWDAKTVGEWAREVDGADVVVNLVGRSVNCRYTDANRREILVANDEYSGLLGGDEPDAPPAWRFSTDVARAWEAAATHSVQVPVRPLASNLVVHRSKL